MNSSQIRGHLFEIFVLKLVLKSGYKLVPVGGNVRKTRYNAYEIRGRGTTHQIDIPVDLNYHPSFLYPIRMLGEVKWHKDPISKELIREEIGKMKDIQENYLGAQYLSNRLRNMRRLELFSYFSATGFELEAEKLAFAHGIRTISYCNNYIIAKNIYWIDILAEALSKLPEAFQKKYLRNLYKVLIENCDWNDKSLPFGKEYISSFEENIKTSFIGSTESGLAIHFLSEEKFPDYLFENSDSVFCRIKDDNVGNWYLSVIGKNNKEIKFFFSMPELVLKEFFDINNSRFYTDKKKHFKKVYFDRMINEKRRLLEFEFDVQWFLEEQQNA